MTSSVPHSAADGKARPIAQAVLPLTAQPIAPIAILETLHGDEVILLLLRPSAWLIVLNVLGSLGWILAFTILFMWIPRLPLPQGWIGWNDTQAALSGAGLCAVRLAWSSLDWSMCWFVLTDRRIITRRGIVSVRLFEAPLAKLQHSIVVQSVSERVLGLGTIGFATAGSDTFVAMWETVRRPFEVHRTVLEAIERYGNRRDGV
ncbi:MAG: PH domain-containing protein [Phycisphaerales bacterium]|nr:PH domain-containing protein [Phycisphaerales bacterium]